MKTMKILAVDDDPIILDLLTEVLRAAGFMNLHLCLSGSEALELIEKEQVPFDCLLLDIQMPDMDGIELMSKIRRIPGYGSTPILMITAMADRKYIDRAFTAGASDYITKPFEIGEIHARLNAFEKLTLDRHQLQDRNPVSQQGPQRSVASEEELAECLALPGIDGFIEYLALENYLLRMSRLSLYGMSVFGVVVPEMTRLFAASSVYEFRFAVTDIAEAIFDSLKTEHFLAAHAGGGTFVCVLTGGTQFDAEGFEALLRDTIREMDLHFCDGRPMILNPAVGEPISLHLQSPRNAANTLVQALSRAQSAANAPRGRVDTSRSSLKQLFGF